MCSRINVVSVNVLEPNPAKPADPIKLEITFEVFENIKEGLFLGTEFRDKNCSKNLLEYQRYRVGVGVCGYRWA